jgi:hypothetical protein
MEYTVGQLVSIKVGRSRNTAEVVAVIQVYAHSGHTLALLRYPTGRWAGHTFRFVLP